MVINPPLVKILRKQNHGQIKNKSKIQVKIQIKSQMRIKSQLDVAIIAKRIRIGLKIAGIKLIIHRNRVSII